MKPSATYLQHLQLSYTEVLQQPSHWREQVLGAICFYDAATVVWSDDTLPCLPVAMPPLAASAPMCEVWHSSTPVTCGQDGDIQYRCNEEFVFGMITLAEADFAGDLSSTPLQLATALAYQQITALLDKLNFAHVLRFWNYMADINAESHDLERYRQFNIGRQSGLLAQGRAVTGGLPAACALGAASGPLSIAFLAGRVAPVAIENPRQLSACAYPSIYGPRSPTFSRASLLQWAGGECLFISGTASIVGHESLHAGDVVAQTQETLKNIEAVLVIANQQENCGRFDLSDLQYIVYVKYPVDLAKIRAVLEAAAGTNVHAIYVQADVCRQELLVEIEATRVMSGKAIGCA
ncbi:MAG: hypothetical protein WC426_12960 [Sulfuriferula sp.]